MYTMAADGGEFAFAARGPSSPSRAVGPARAATYSMPLAQAAELRGPPEAVPVVGDHAIAGNQ